MNTTLKLGIASALALGGAAAHAQIAAPSTGSSTVLLFAEILNSSDAIVASYGGNTGVSVAAAYAGTNATFAATSNLTALFNADAAGDTLLWAVEGSQYTGTNNAPTQSVAGSTTNVTTAQNPAQIPLKTSSTISSQNSVLGGTITALNNNITNGVDIEGTAPSAAGVWDANVTSNNASVLGGISTAITGTGTVALYDITGTGSVSSKLNTVTLGTVSLSSSGLVFATSSVAPPPVPLPPAVWLLGSGLLGLAGVARRKAKA